MWPTRHDIKKTNRIRCTWPKWCNKSPQKCIAVFQNMSWSRREICQTRRLARLHCTHIVKKVKKAAQLGVPPKVNKNGCNTSFTSVLAEKALITTIERFERTLNFNDLSELSNKNLNGELQAHNCREIGVWWRIPKFQWWTFGGPYLTQARTKKFWCAQTLSRCCIWLQCVLQRGFVRRKTHYAKKLVKNVKIRENNNEREMKIYRNIGSKPGKREEPQGRTCCEGKNLKINLAFLWIPECFIQILHKSNFQHCHQRSQNVPKVPPLEY